MNDPRTGQPFPPSTIQRVLYSCGAVHVYALPPLTSMKGYLAASWTSNSDSEIFAGRLRVLESAVPVKVPASKPATTTALRTPNRPLALPEEEPDVQPETTTTTTTTTTTEEEEEERLQVDILLEEAGGTHELFAAAPYVDAGVVEQTLDSSRFFALRVEGEGKKAVLGLGFEERSEAFDFSVALQEARKILSMSTPASLSMASGGDAGKDLSLRPGESISVALRREPKTGEEEEEEEDREEEEEKKEKQEKKALFSLPPPPSASSSSLSSSSSRRRPPASSTSAII
ncbi:hypothetical protein TEQG_03867 [Trichophyton equinum CBS 127.97]|uniref:NECAP PHear domain-containing protein n=1 Tax=Trichophyton equinum (strain ATCC MYA-4606 / CBS 127.97) TaxID=559882 RepID=F2PSB4_TRIEC|nr:hypothetical protein TEQG_03867 [Trichophyton equinum CBS 127.97]